MKVLFAVEHPEPSDDGPTIDMGDKPTPDGGGDDLADDSTTVGEDLFGGDSSSGGGFGGGGIGLDSSDTNGGDTESSAPAEELKPELSPEEQYVQTNFDTYKQLTDDINRILEDLSVQEKKVTEKDSEYVMKKLRDYQWSNNTLLELSSLGSTQKDGKLSNLDNLIKDIINDKNKNLSLKNQQLSTLLKARGGNYHMPKVKFSFSPDGSVTKTEVADETKKATSNAEKFLIAKEATSTAIVKARKAIKALNAKATTARGLLFKKMKLSETDMAAPELEAPVEEMKELDSDIASETGQIGGVAQELQETLSVLTDSINKLTDAVDSLDAGEVPKEEYDNGMELVEEGKEVAKEGDEQLEDVEELEEEIKEAFIKKPKVKSAMEHKKEEKESSKEDEKKEEAKEASSKVSSKKAGAIASIRKAEQLVSAIQEGTIESEQDLKAIPDAVVASWKNMPEVISSLRKAGKESMVEAIIERTIDAHLNTKTAGVKQAKYTDKLVKDIGETSKVMNTREYDKWFQQGSGDIAKGAKSEHGKFNTDTSEFPERFGEPYGSAESAMGSEHVKGKKASITLSTEAALKVRKAFEVAGEEQFKSIIANPLAARMIQAFQEAGMSEDKAVEASFEVLADSFEESVKGLIQRGLTYANASETELLRRAKDVSTFKIALFSEEERTAAAEGEVEQVRTASAKKPALRTVSTEQTSVDIKNIFDRLRA